MIGFLRGIVVQLLATCCLLDVNGVGYRVYISDVTRRDLRLNEEALVYTHMSVREDAIQLYGFAKQDEFNIFQLLIAVSGIGPKVALGILSAITVDGLCKAIHGKQLQVLTKLPGIGKKTAERLILELKDKIALPEEDAGTVENNVKFFPGENHVEDEAIEALRSLGYSDSEIKPALKAAKNCTTVESYIKFALRELARRA